MGRHTGQLQPSFTVWLSCFVRSVFVEVHPSGNGPQEVDDALMMPHIATSGAPGSPRGFDRPTAGAIGRFSTGSLKPVCLLR